MESQQKSPGAIQDFLKELLDISREMERVFFAQTFENIDIRKLVEFSAAVRAVHTRLMKDHSQSDGRSRIIERFFNQWNNMVFGIFYVGDLAEKNKSLTERQFRILAITLQEINRYTKKFGITD